MPIYGICLFRKPQGTRYRKKYRKEHGIQGCPLGLGETMREASDNKKAVFVDSYGLTKTAGNLSMAEREGFEPSIRVLARILA